MSWNDSAGTAAMATSASAPLATAGSHAPVPQRALEDAAIGMVVVDDQHPHALSEGGGGRRRRLDDAKVRVESKRTAASHRLDRDDAAHPRDELCRW